MAFGGTRVTLEPLDIYPCSVPVTKPGDDVDASRGKRALTPIDHVLGRLDSAVNAKIVEKTRVPRWRVKETAPPDPDKLDSTIASLVSDMRGTFELMHLRLDVPHASTTGPDDDAGKTNFRQIRFVERFPVFFSEPKKPTPTFDFETKTWTRDTFPGVHPRAREDVYALERWLKAFVRLKSYEGAISHESDDEKCEMSRKQKCLQNALKAHTLVFDVLVQHVATECRDRADLLTRVFTHNSTLLELKLTLDMAPKVVEAVAERNIANKKLIISETENENLREELTLANSTIENLNTQHELERSDWFTKNLSLSHKLLTVVTDDVEAREASAMAHRRENELRLKLRATKNDGEKNKNSAVLLRWRVLHDGVCGRDLMTRRNRNQAEIIRRIRDATVVDLLVDELTGDQCLAMANAEIEKLQSKASSDKFTIESLRREILEMTLSANEARTTHETTLTAAYDATDKVTKELGEAIGARDDARFAAREARGEIISLSERLGKINSELLASQKETAALREISSDAVARAEQIQKHSDTLQTELNLTTETLRVREHLSESARAATKGRVRAFKKLIRKIELETKLTIDGNDDQGIDPVAAPEDVCLVTVYTNLSSVSLKACELLNNLRKDRDRILVETGSLTTRLAVCTRDAFTSAATSSRLKSELKDCEQQRETLDMKSRALEDKLGKREAELKQRADEIDDLNTEVGGISQKLGDVESLRRLFADTRDKLSNAETTVVDMTSEGLVSRVENASLRAKVREIDYKLSSERTRRLETDTANKRLQTTVDALRARLLVMSEARDCLAAETVALDLKHTIDIDERDNAIESRNDAISTSDALRKQLTIQRQKTEKETLLRDIADAEGFIKASQQEEIRVLAELKQCQALYEDVNDTWTGDRGALQGLLEFITTTRIEMDAAHKSIESTKCTALDSLAKTRRKKLVYAQRQKDAATQCDEGHTNCGRTIRPTTLGFKVTQFRV